MLHLRSKPSSASKKSSVASQLEKLGLRSPVDFLLHFPLRYEDETQISRIDQACAGGQLQVEGEVISSQVAYQPRRSLTAVLRDESGQIQLRWLHFYPSQVQQMQPGKRWRVRGEVRAGYHGLELVHPRITSPSQALPTALTPVYPASEGVSQRLLRQRIDAALNEVDLSDTLPQEIPVPIAPDVV